MKNLKKNFLTLALTAALSLGIAAPASAVNAEFLQQMAEYGDKYERENYAEISRKADQRIRERQIAYEKKKAARQNQVMQAQMKANTQVKKAPAVKKYKKKAVKKRAYK